MSDEFKCLHDECLVFRQRTWSKRFAHQYSATTSESGRSQQIYLSIAASSKHITCPPHLSVPLATLHASLELKPSHLCLAQIRRYSHAAQKHLDVGIASCVSKSQRNRYVAAAAHSHTFGHVANLLGGRLGQAQLACPSYCCCALLTFTGSPALCRIPIEDSGGVVAMAHSSVNTPATADLNENTNSRASPGRMLPRWSVR